MKKVVLSVVAAVALATPALAADLKMLTKAPPPPPSPWDFAFGDAIMTDYMWRGITQSNHRGSVAAYFEPRYNFSDSLQGYVGLSGESIDFPNHAAAEIDFYGGIRPTFGKLALDFGAWLYYYPGGQCFSGGVCHRNRAGRLRQLQCRRQLGMGRRLPINGNARQGLGELLRDLRQGHLHGERLLVARRPGVLFAVGLEYRRQRHLRGRHHQVYGSGRHAASEGCRLLRLGRTAAIGGSERPTPSTARRRSRPASPIRASPTSTSASASPGRCSPSTSATPGAT